MNPALNAVVSLDGERAEAAAAAADGAVARGDALGRLHGLPITLKDAYEVGGWTSTGGSPMLATHVPAVDVVVAALRGAGVVLLGRTNVPSGWVTSRPTTRCSARRTTPGTPPARRADRRAVPVRRWRPA